MKRCVIDTNVLITANKVLSCPSDGDVSLYPDLLEKCVKILLQIKKKRTYVVLDTDDEIYGEYKKYLNFSGQPGVGDIFFKWLNDNRYSFPDTERISLHKEDHGYLEFPPEMYDVNVDPSDMIFFAVSNAHKYKPVILEATDAKWWNWKDAAKKFGIHIMFIDEQYMRDHNPIK